jgi:hypothetical protein
MQQREQQFSSRCAADDPSITLVVLPACEILDWLGASTHSYFTAVAGTAKPHQAQQVMPCQTSTLTSTLTSR